MQVADLFAKLGLKVDKKSFSAADRLLKGVKQGLVALGVFQGVRFLKDLVTDSVELGDNLAKVSNQLNIGTTALQELEFAAKRSDLEFSSLTQGLKFLTKNAFAAANGNKEMRKNFRQLGVSVSELKSLKPDELLLEVADAFEKLPEGQKIARAMEIFGKQGAELVPFLSKGKKGIAELRKEAERLGIIISPEQVKMFEEADDKFNDFSFTIRKVKAVIATTLLPVVEKYLGRLQTWLSNTDNQEKLFRKVEKAVAVFATVLDKIVVAFDWMIENWDTLEPILIALVSIWAIGKIASFASTLGSIVGMLGGLGPIAAKAGSFVGTALGGITAAGLATAGAVTAAVAGVGVAIHDIARAARGEWDKAFFAPVHEGISNLLMDLEEAVNPIEDREKNRRETLRFFNPDEAARRDERDKQRKEAAQAMRRGQFNPANYPALYPEAAANKNGGTTNVNGATANITVNAPPGMSPEEIGKKIVQSFNDLLTSSVRTANVSTAQ
jgi:hypothetical protein